MKNLMSRFGGHALIFGAGKASASQLPENQSVDYLLDNYAKEIIPSYYFISSYDAKPEFMGSLDWDMFDKKPIKLGVLEHSFTDIFLQYDPTVFTSIYITNHQYENVYAIIIKTHEKELKDYISDYFESYDYVLQVFIRSKYNYKLNGAKLEKILLLLFYKMNLIYSSSIKSFKPSKTHLGKFISKEFETSVKSVLKGVNTDNKLKYLLENK